MEFSFFSIVESLTNNAEQKLLTFLSFPGTILQNAFEENAMSAEEAQAWLQQGLMLCERDRYEEALSAFDQAIAVDPDLGSAYNEKGKC